MRTFFKILRDCGIKPYVVIDGGSDKTDKKFDTLLGRANSRAKVAHEISMGRRGELTPTLSNCVFTQVLSSLNVPFAHCINEADQEIASLARTWGCPVLSSDSDFCIVDIPEGFLPIDHFNWKRGTQRDGIPCKLYTTASFCRHFNVHSQILPVFAAIAKKNYNSHYLTNQSLMVELLKSLAGIQEQQEALNMVPPEFHADLHLVTEEYKFINGHLEQFFNEGVAPGHGDLPGHLSVLPAWTLLPLMKGETCYSMVYVLLRLPVILSTQVEDPSQTSGHVTSLPIRQVAYGLLLGRGESIQEYDREGQIYTINLVKAVLPRSAQHLDISTLHQASHEVRLEVFLETLRVTKAMIHCVPPHLGLPVAVTSYWLRHAHPRPEMPLLQALLIGMVYGEHCRETTGQKEPVVTSLKALIQPASMELNLGVAHAFSQWQSCLRETLKLNKLLCFPVPEPQVAWLYKGTLVHQLVTQLRTGLETPDSLLMEDRSSVQLYRAMLNAVQNS
ncbi:hypothetical protein DPEC_G00052490 [Dallia pectoralis]|uniref:Uncharacterized protein n=1 Tax=Dallia pectoralis TaxID=75939 RepID=A0ACC2HBG3_DALPE|nr:hypothetical protein DPEC_G00052490 [Dallia pectoralis]